MSTQLSLFDNLSDKPLPEIIAQENDFPLAFQDVDGVRYYAVQDWISGVAQTDHPRQFWTHMQKRLEKEGVELSPRWLQLAYTAKNGRTYQMDHADANTLYQITQRMDANTGLRDAILKFLASAGVRVDEYRRDPDKMLADAQQEIKRKQDITGYQIHGKTEAWSTARVNTKASQKMLNAEATHTHVDHAPNYGKIGDAQNKALFDMSKAQLIDYLGITPAQEKKWRDNLGKYALEAVDITNRAAARKLKETGEGLTTIEQIEIVREVASRVAPLLKSLAEIDRVDYISGDEVDADGRRLSMVQTKMLRTGK